jgi:hypothetical protein
VRRIKPAARSAARSVLAQGLPAPAPLDLRCPMPIGRSAAQFAVSKPAPMLPDGTLASLSRPHHSLRPWQRLEEKAHRLEHRRRLATPPHGGEPLPTILFLFPSPLSASDASRSTRRRCGTVEEPAPLWTPYVGLQHSKGWRLESALCPRRSSLFRRW